jgi:CDP-glucose 4,6-dehydratase
MAAADPEIVLHLAAQALVRPARAEPVETFSTNVVGTAQVLDAVRATPGVRACVVVTSDKVYDNVEWPWAYRETDRLGGKEPYGASKACTEIVVESYRASYFSGEGHPASVATARAGNVIGGGDWAMDRLIPDMMRAVSRNEKVTIRNPQAVRPWQHVLEPLSGYLLLGQKLLEGRKEFAEAWNFGPGEEGTVTVREICAQIKTVWPKIDCEINALPGQPHEAGLLRLDCSKARTRLSWSPVWDGKTAIEKTALWYRAFYETNALRSLDDLACYIKDARSSHLAWAEA